MNTLLTGFRRITSFLQVGKVEERSHAKAWSSERDFTFRDMVEIYTKCNRSTRGSSDWFCLRCQGRHQRREDLSYLPNASRSPLVNWQLWKPSKVPYRCKYSIPFISNQWESYCDVSVKVQMELHVPNLFGEQQVSFPTCVVEKVQTTLTAASHPGM